MNSSKLELAACWDLRVGVSSGARRGFCFAGSDLLLGSGEVPAMTIGRRLSRAEVRKQFNDVKRKRVRNRQWSRKRYEVSEESRREAICGTVGRSGWDEMEEGR